MIVYKLSNNIEKQSLSNIQEINDYFAINMKYNNNYNTIIINKNHYQIISCFFSKELYRYFIILFNIYTYKYTFYIKNLDTIIGKSKDDISKIYNNPFDYIILENTQENINIIKKYPSFKMNKTDYTFGIYEFEYNTIEELMEDVYYSLNNYCYFIYDKDNDIELKYSK